MMVFLETIGVLLSIGLLVVLSLRGLNIVVAAPLALLVALVFNGFNFFDSAYLQTLASFISNNFMVFLLGAILGQLMSQSGGTVTIARAILKVFGTDRPYAVLLGITLVAACLTYGGISIFVVLFALVPMVRPIFKELDINWKLVGIPVMLGGSTFTMTMLPGSPAIHNILPSQTLQTPLTAAPAMSIMATLGALAFGLAYMKYELDRSLAKGEHFYSYLDQGQAPAEEEEDILTEDLPALWRAVLPLLVLMGTILIFSDQDQVAVYALALAIVLTLPLNRAYLPSLKEAFNQGAGGALGSVFATASSAAFGSSLTALPGFETMQNGIFALPIGPALKASLLTIILTALTASSSASIGIMMDSYVGAFLEAGLSAEYLHRLVAIASGVMTVLPYGGVMQTFNQLTGLSSKNSFPNIFITVSGSHLLALLICLLYGYIFG